MNIGMIGRDEDFFQKVKLKYNVAVYDTSIWQNVVLYDKDCPFVEYVRPSDNKYLDCISLIYLLTDVIFNFEGLEFKSNKIVVFFKKVPLNDNTCYFINNELFGNSNVVDKVKEVLLVANG